jgi:D-alanyl-lipoteichoic acid acyltransferase DltB (MBOAT superfamily)
MVASTFALVCCFLLKSHPGSATQRKVFSTLTGLFIHYYVFGIAGLASLATNIVSYAMIRLMPRETQHIGIFIVSGLALALCQIHKQVFNFGENGLDLPMNLMFNYCRVTSLACCIRDGLTMKESREKGIEPDLKRREKVYAVEEIPSFFDFISYLYFCGAAISGPFYEFKDFQQMMAREGDFKDVPSTLRPGLMRFLNAWMCVISGAILASLVDEKFMLTQEFLNEYSILAKLFY